MLISCDVSSLVIDRLCEHAAGEKAAVAYFYIDFAAQKEQSPVDILGSVLKQIVGGLDQVPEGIVQTFEGQKEIAGGRKPVLSEIVKLLQDISSSRSTFICIDALDECRAGHRPKLLDSLNQILQKSPRVRIFLTGRPHVRGEVERHLPRRVETRSIAPTKDDIALYLRERLKADTMPDAMDRSLREEIIQTIHEIVSEG